MAITSFEAVIRHTPPMLELPTSPINGRVSPSIGQGVEPFQLMMDAKALPAVEFVDYTFVFH